MARTIPMKLIELMVLKQDISKVLEYIGKKESFEFMHTLEKDDSEATSTMVQTKEENSPKNIFSTLNKVCTYFELPIVDFDLSNVTCANQEDYQKAESVIQSFNEISNHLSDCQKELSKVSDANKEALAFANLQSSFSELEHLSFLSMKIGKIESSLFDQFKNALSSKAIVIALGEDKSNVLVAASKKNTGLYQEDLKNFGFVEMPIPKDFKGVPEDVLISFTKRKEEIQKKYNELLEQKSNYAQTHKEIIHKLYKTFAVTLQINQIEQKLESTEHVYRITGWIPFTQSKSYTQDLVQITEERIAITEYDPSEVKDVLSGKEKVPVKLQHGKFVKSFERMIFSYGSPVYGTIDPTPFVAVFFTLLFGIMFGDLGQGLVFLLLGFLMAKNIVKVGNWNKFAAIFMAIGITSSIMGLLTGEFFSNETLLKPFSIWVTSLFGKPYFPIVKLMPSQGSIMPMFIVFGVAVGIGFVINTIGLLINIVNNLILKKWDKAFFGKEGLSGAIFFWYVIVLVIRIAAFSYSVKVVDWAIILLSLFFASFAEPFENAIMKRKKIFENGFGTFLISGLVELIEVVSGYLSNTVSFVRVGAFALSHAVLDFTILTLTNLVGGEASFFGVLILIVGNAIIIVLEGMIVAIQVIRLQYYEFFSKFFHETGKEFKPFKFELKV